VSKPLNSLTQMMRRAMGVALLLPIMLSCSEPEAIQPCIVDADCTPGLQCVAATCVPADTCAAGIYTADELPSRADSDAPSGLVRQVSGLAAGVSIDDGSLRIVHAGEPRLFELDYFDDPDKADGLGLFVETRMQLAADSNECSAVMYLWPTKADQIKLCFGGGKIGLARPGGGSTGLVSVVPDLTESHVYRIDFKPISAAANDTGPAEGNRGFVIEISIDGELAAGGLTIADLPNPDQPSDRAPLVGFGADAAGTVSFDYIRWGCDSKGGTCLPDLEEDDEACETTRQSIGACGGNAKANELCDNLDNDCDGNVDENYTKTFPEGRPIAFDGFGEEVFKGENCGLVGACAAAIVVCDDAGTGLVCDVSEVSQPEVCNGQDSDCDGLIDEDFGGASLLPEKLYVDPNTDARIALNDPCGVGVCAGGRVVCENLRAICSTDMLRQDNEACGNAEDDDCDGLTDEGFDLDGDEYQNCLRCAAEVCEAGAHDCNDTVDVGFDIHPGAPEICNQIDDNCDGEQDEGLDLDGDGVLPCDPVPDCSNDPTTDVEGKPSAFEVNPNADEACDETDNDCDGRVDEGFSQLQPNGSVLYTSRPNCGQCGNNCSLASEEFNTIASCTERPGGGFGCSTECRPGFNDVDGDVAAADQFWNTEGEEDNKGCECRVRADTICDSGNVNRACTEICNGIDDDCDGGVDEAADLDMPACWDGAPEQRQVGICRDGVRRCIDGRQSEQCFGSTLPEAGQERLCDNRDEDCDNRVDEGDALTDPSGQIRAGDECSTGLDGICAAGRQACVANEIRCVAGQNQLPEFCNGLDDDCDGVFEEDTDADGDGVPRCRPCANGEVPFNDPETNEAYCVFDCNDEAGNGREGIAFSPNIDERCTGLDNDCDERVDEEFVLRNAMGHPIDLNDQLVFGDVGLVYNQINNCGACGVECTRPNGLTHCDRGACTLVSCREGFLDDDGDPDNGCEQSDCRDENVGPENVRLLGTQCTKPMYDNASECACSGVYRCLRRGGVPTVECEVDPNNPDEGDIVSPAECPNGQRANVEAELCNGLDNDCDGQADEIFVLQDDNTGEPILGNDGNPIYATVEHCGDCGEFCSPPFTLISDCGQGTCGITRCLDGRVDLNGVVEDGCEYACEFGGQEACNGVDDNCNGDIDETFDLESDLNNCGRCGHQCAFANAGASCVAGECVLGACGVGFDDCDLNAATGCETNLNEVATCGGCNNSCNADATSGCVNQQCRCGQNAPCAGENAVCDDVLGDCTGCLDNLDCGGDTQFCVSSSCQECNPLNDDGCLEAGATPICNGGTCEGCGSDAECVVRFGSLDFCDEATARCVQCDPSNNAGCPANSPTCDTDSLSCRQCANADDCLGSACVGGTCSGCDLNSNFPCSGGTPICAQEDGGSPECQACIQGDVGDAECARKDPGTPECVQGRCQACEPISNDGCGANQLCCNFVCVDTDPSTQCQNCGVACDATTTNSCVDRNCSCGADGECGGQTAFCDDPTDTCVNCRADNDCGGARPECVDDSCETCDPTANLRCNAQGTSPVCDPDNKFCRGCRADGDCTNDAAVAALVDGGECTADGSCRFCDPADNANCDAAGVRPICDAGSFDCRTCGDHPECATNANGNVCAGSGRCTACQSDADCDGHPIGNLCNDAVNPAICGVCANDAACTDHPDGNRCVGTDCVACAVSADCAGNPAGNTCVAGRCEVCQPGTNEGCTGTEPICGNNGCQACDADLECGDNSYCIEAAVDGIAEIDVGSCQRCDPTGDTGCDAASDRPICDPTFFLCRVCAADAECGADQQCVGGACETCDPATDDGCDAATAIPICRDVNGTLACAGCVDDAECAENPRNGSICVGGACAVCDVADQSGCRDDELCCDQGGGPTCVSTGSGDGEVCTACGVNGCNANSTNTCANRACVCGNDAQCAGDDFCVAGACVNCIRDADCSQDAAGSRCVENDCVECRNSADCRAQTPVCENNSCRACANNAECGNQSVCQQDDGSCTGDRDGDGVDDAADNCPNDANPDQADNDVDGSGDACDDDDDNDGTEDATDNCPLEANPDQLNSDNAADGGNACDPDDDNDGLLDAVDNCPLVANQNQADFDLDGLGDACDDDRDGDGVTNAADNCPDVVNAAQEDLDNDNIGDLCDDDRDGDGDVNGADNCPDLANADQADADNDGLGDVCDPDRDGDGVANGGDNCPDDANPGQEDADGDTIGDACDNDRDGDTVADGIDNCPDVSNVNQDDNDDDGSGDVCDDDDDGDGHLDGDDNCPFIANPDQLNTDGEADGGDACDDDDDDDGHLDGADNCPLIVNADQADNDEDGDGDACDADDDNDGHLDGADNCPFAANADQLNTDGEADGGDACDDDDDDDGHLDGADNCPLIANADQLNTDGEADGGNACDDDDDDDGIDDLGGDADNCPLIANGVAEGESQLDTDNDGQGDACDDDDDDDTVPDDEDNCRLVDNGPNDDDNQTDTDADAVGDACDNCPAGVNPDQVDTDDNGAGDICDSPLVINEVDYSNPGGDTEEFVEILNITGVPQPIADVELRIVDAAGNTDTVILNNAGANLGAGEFLVIGDNSVRNALAEGILSTALPGNSLSDDPRALVLINTTTNQIYDSVAYEAAVSVEGVNQGESGPTSADEQNIMSLERCPAGTDTGDNSVDFKLGAATPGAANGCAP
jgi:hypothetical protein